MINILMFDILYEQWCEHFGHFRKFSGADLGGRWIGWLATPSIELLLLFRLAALVAREVVVFVCFVL